MMLACLGTSRIPSRDARLVDVPAATRTRSPGWRDPRLWVGVVLVTGSVVAGARILAGADDMTSVWAASGDLAAGQTLRPTTCRRPGCASTTPPTEQRYLAGRRRAAGRR